MYNNNDRIKLVDKFYDEDTGMEHRTLAGDVKDIVDQLLADHPTCEIVLIHGCNCLNNMGAGLARRIRVLYPLAYYADKDTKSHDRNKLGTYSCASIESNFTIINLYTQFKYGGGKPNVDYNAMANGFDKIIKDAGDRPDIIYLIPKYIGCGLAGGDISIVEPMIKDKFKSAAYYLFEK